MSARWGTSYLISWSFCRKKIWRRRWRPVLWVHIRHCLLMSTEYYEYSESCGYMMNMSTSSRSMTYIVTVGIVTIIVRRKSSWVACPPHVPISVNLRQPISVHVLLAGHFARQDMAVFFNGIRALGHFVRCDTCPMLKKTVVPTCSNITEKKRILQCILGEQQFWQQFWPDNWLPFSTSNRNRPQMAGLSLASRSFSQDLESEAMVSGSEARMWNIRGTSVEHPNSEVFSQGPRRISMSLHVVTVRYCMSP